MIVCLAKNYQEFAKWRDEKVVYVGDAEDLAKIDPNGVAQIRLIGDYDKHPVYFSDAFFDFQCEVSRANGTKPKRRRFRRRR